MKKILILILIMILIFFLTSPETEILCPSLVTKHVSVYQESIRFLVAKKTVDQDKVRKGKNQLYQIVSMLIGLIRANSERNV